MPYYHVWFGTRRRRWALQGEAGEVAKELLQAVAREKAIRLIECEAVVDHVHLLIEADDRTALSGAMNSLKGISARRLFQRFPDLKHDLVIKSFWQEGFAFKTVSREAFAPTRRYIATQWERLEGFER